LFRRRTFLLGTAALGLVQLRAAIQLHARASESENSITLSDASGEGASDYPLRLGRPFVQGEIAGVPQAQVDGRAIPTQADIKLRWPDGSVKHAILSFVVPHIPRNGTSKISFGSGNVDKGAGLSAEQMLDAGFDFDAVIAITRNGQTQLASARSMLKNHDFTVWCEGPVATTILLADHSAARKYDFGFEPLRPLRPIFHATLWAGLRKVQVRTIGENCCTESMQDISYSLILKSGLATPAEVFRQDHVPHYAGTRWTHSFWIGGAPNSAIDVDHNLAYLVKTFAFPNFDSALEIPESVIADSYAKWQKKPRNLYDSGGWTKDMEDTGGRDDIGPYTSPQAKWLFTGDHRLYEIVSTQADLAGAWPLHAREGNHGKWYDTAHKVPAIGRPLSVYARPSLWLFDERDESKPEDRVQIGGERILSGTIPPLFGGWAPNGAHIPDPYSALYTLTGDYFALEQLQLWAASSALSYNPSYRGPEPSGAIFDQVRGNAWVLRNRVHAAFLSPDKSPEKEYFTLLINDAIAFWEGMHDIRGTRFEKSAIWSFAKTNQLNVSPLHFFRENVGIRAKDFGELKGGSFAAAAPMWMQYMLIFELGRAGEKGYPVGPLLSWTGILLTSQFKEPDTYSPYNVQRYNTAVRNKDGAFYHTWTETLASYLNPNPPVPIRPDVCDGYAAYAYGACTMLTKEPDGLVAYNWLRQNVYQAHREKYAQCPKWPFLPRP